MLQGGTTYAWILDTFADRDGISGLANAGTKNGFEDGHFFNLNVLGGDRMQHFASNWDDQLTGPPPTPSTDLAFRVTFVEPFFIVNIDIKPRNALNRINPKSRGKILVAILTTDSFDAMTVDQTTVRFGATGMEAAPVGKVILRDVDKDGDIDMLLRFKIQDTDIECGDTSASLTGQILGGQLIEGTDFIETVGCP